MSREEDGNGWILKYFKRYGNPLKSIYVKVTLSYKFMKIFLNYKMIRTGT